MNLITLSIIGLSAGVLSGLFGIGGGVLIVPALILICKFSMVEAVGTSLAALMLPVGLLGVLVYRKAKIIDLRASLLLSLGILLTVGFGAWAANTLPQDQLKRLYGLFLLYVSLRFIQPIALYRHIRHNEKPPKDHEEIPHPKSTTLVGAGTATGFMAGLFGMAGGNVIIPMLTTCLKYPTKRAMATSLGALLPPIGLPGVICYYKAGNLDLMNAWPVALGLFIGTLFGARFAVRIPAIVIKRLYGLFLLIIALRFTF